METEVSILKLKSFFGSSTKPLLESIWEREVKFQDVT